MKYVYQDKFGDEGNCLQACFASLLELQLHEVPHFVDSPNWLNDINRFLHKIGLRMIYTANLYAWPENSFYMRWGKSPRGLDHSAIYWNDILSHDPHPEGGGIVDLDGLAYLVWTCQQAFPQRQDESESDGIPDRTTKHTGH